MSHAAAACTQPPLAVPAASGNGRKGSKKVRTGCHTCKKRKLKCDECKPACRRCMKSGWACDWNTRPLLEDKAINPGPSLSGTLQPLSGFTTQKEKRIFQFFTTVTAPNLDSGSTSRFWTVVVPMFCSATASIRHAVLAVSSLYESIIYDGSSLDVQLADKQVFALTQYNKALSALSRQSIDTYDKEPLTLLLLCILFACLEYLQGKQFESLIHIQQGRKLLHRIAGSQQQLPESIRDIVRQNIIPVYIRSAVASTSSGIYPWPIPKEVNMFSQVPHAFGSIEEASHNLYSIIDDTMRWRMAYKIMVQSSAEVPTDFAYNACQTNSNHPPLKHIATLESEQNALLSQLSKWHSAFSIFRATTTEQAPITNFVLLLQIHYHIINIWASTALSEKEIAYDKHIDSFSAILPLCAEHLTETRFRSPEGIGEECIKPDNTQRPRFSIFDFETGVIACLFFTAAKCRHHHVRRTAVSLLQRYGERQENIWHAESTALYASRFVEIETEAADAFWHRNTESSLALEALQDPDSASCSGLSTIHDERSTTTLNNLSMVDSSEAPLCRILQADFGIPEHLRIAEAQIVDAKRNGARWAFYRKPNEFSSNWESWEEFIEVG